MNSIDIPAGTIARLPLFADLEETTADQLLQHVRRRIFPARSIIYFEGEWGQTVYVILTGEIGLRRTTPAGTQILLASLGPGEAFGEAVVFGPAHRDTDAITHTDSELLLLDASLVSSCMDRSPRLTYNLCNMLEARIRGAMNRVEMLTTARNVMGRLAYYLIDRARFSTEPYYEAELPRFRRASLAQMADSIGASREQISRSLSELQKNGILQMNADHVVILDMTRLEQLLRQSG